MTLDVCADREDSISCVLQGPRTFTADQRGYGKGDSPLGHGEMGKTKILTTGSRSYSAN